MGLYMKKVNATEGALTRLIFVYTIPLIFSTILQSLFDIADKAVLGNMAGTVAVASIAATGTVSSLVINGAVGLSTGTVIVLARFIGERNKEKVRAAIDTSLITSVVFGVVVAVAGVLLAPFFLTMTDCPAECYDGALIYMRIVIAAAPATLLYNYGAAILRTLGDTQRPLIYIAVSGAVNVVLNVILCLIFPQKVVAVAVATVVSNCISAALVFLRLCRMEEETRVVPAKMRFDRTAFLKVLRFGIPASISALVLPLGNLQITAAINSFGPDAIAGHAAACSVETIVFAFSTGFGSATMTFMGQNIGASNVERVRQSFWRCLVYTFFITGTLGYLMYLSGEMWVGIIVGSDSAAAIEYGMLRMFHVIQFACINAVSNVLISALKAFGYPILTSITNIAFNLGFRVLWMQFIYPLNPQYRMIMLCYTVAWTLNLIFYIIFLFGIYRRYVKTGVCRKI